MKNRITTKPAFGCKFPVAKAMAATVAVVLATGTMNANPLTARLPVQSNRRNTVEMCSRLWQTVAPTALEIAQVPQKPAYNPPPRKADGTLLAPNVSDPEIYINSERFKGLDGKNYYIIYNNAGADGHDLWGKECPVDAVYYVYIVPEDYNFSPKYRLSLPPRVEAFINHNDEFIGVKLWERTTNFDVSEKYSEVRLPEDVLGKIMDIMLEIDNPPYKFSGEVKLIRTESSELLHSWELW